MSIIYILNGSVNNITTVAADNNSLNVSHLDANSYSNTNSNLYTNSSNTNNKPSAESSSNTQLETTKNTSTNVAATPMSNFSEVITKKSMSSKKSIFNSKPTLSQAVIDASNLDDFSKSGMSTIMTSEKRSDAISIAAKNDTETTTLPIVSNQENQVSNVQDSSQKRSYVGILKYLDNQHDIAPLGTKKADNPLFFDFKKGGIKKKVPPLKNHHLSVIGAWGRVNQGAGPVMGLEYTYMLTRFIGIGASVSSQLRRTSNASDSIVPYKYYWNEYHGGLHLNLDFALINNQKHFLKVGFGAGANFHDRNYYYYNDILVKQNGGSNRAWKFSTQANVSYQYHITQKWSAGARVGFTGLDGFEYLGTSIGFRF